MPRVSAVVLAIGAAMAMAGSAVATQPLRAPCSGAMSPTPAVLHGRILLLASTTIVLGPVTSGLGTNARRSEETIRWSSVRCVYPKDGGPAHAASLTPTGRINANGKVTGVDPLGITVGGDTCPLAPLVFRTRVLKHLQVGDEARMTCTTFSDGQSSGSIRLSW